MEIASPENDYEKKIHSNIDRVGWHLTSVSSQDSYSYSYSIGLFKTFGHPEVIVVGLPPDVAYSVVKDMVKSIIHSL